MSEPVPIAVWRWRLRQAAEHYAATSPVLDADALLEAWHGQLLATLGSSVADALDAADDAQTCLFCSHQPS